MMVVKNVVKQKLYHQADEKRHSACWNHSDRKTFVSFDESQSIIKCANEDGELKEFFCKDCGLTSAQIEAAAQEACHQLLYKDKKECQ